MKYITFVFILRLSWPEHYQLMPKYVLCVTRFHSGVSKISLNASALS